MQSDWTYASTYANNLKLLFQASGESWAGIPEEYLAHFYHEYEDGDISLLPLVNKLSNTDFLEDCQIDEVVEVLSKVNASEWTDLDSVEAIDAESILSNSFANISDYVEDNLSTADKVEKVLKVVIEDSFDKGVQYIRSRKGKYPSPENNFLQEEDGTFAGIFSYKGHLFNFEIAPTEKGWLCTYRMSEKSLDSLEKPEFTGKSDGKKKQHRKVRSQGWS